MREGVGVSVEWVVKERRGGLWIPVLRVKNLVTTYGLTQMASLWNGSYVAPQWLALDTDEALINATIAPGAVAVVTNKRVDVAGDTNIWLSPGTANSEKLPFSSVTGTGPYTYNLSSATVNTHNSGEKVLRDVRTADTISNIIAEAQYDSVGAPNQRMQCLPGFSPGNGQWTVQFYYTGTQALVHMNTLALMDSATLASGHMHNHFVLGYNHTSGTDVEIDGTLTMTNN